MTGILKAIEICGGSQAALAQKITALGGRKLSQQGVARWIKFGVPVARVKDIELVTDGQVTRGDLRPDFFGDQSEPRRVA